MGVTLDGSSNGFGSAERRLGGPERSEAMAGAEANGG